MPDAALNTAEAAQPAAVPDGPQPPSMIAVAALTAHPGNVRDDLDLTTEFCASVAESGIRIPLMITPGEEGYRVIEGHRRLAAAVKAGLAEVPCTLDTGRAGDEAGQYLDMLVANSGSHRKNFTPVEEAAALFAAHEAGASRTRLRKATGRKADDIKTALQAGRLSTSTRAEVSQLTRQLSLADLALLAEFDGDTDATRQLLEALRLGYNAEYLAERIRQERAEAAEHQRLRTELEAAGYQITGELPPGAGMLTALAHDGEALTGESHAQCPGRGVFFRAWSQLDPVHYCADPSGNGHTSLFAATTAPGGDAAPPGPGTGDSAPPPEPAAGDPARRLVIEGNRAWVAAAEVRRRWVAELLSRRTAPREVAQFVAAQLLTMPTPLRGALGNAHAQTMFAELAGQDATTLVERCATSQPSRLPLLMLAPIVTAYETEICGEGERRSTWREDRYSPCPRTDAGSYLAFLAGLGHQMAPIERAVADGVPYTGDNPAAPLDDSAADPGTAEPSAADQDTADADAGDATVGGDSDAATDDPGPAPQDPGGTPPQE
jgi:ParB family chromosome partitioning protein